MAKKSRKYRHTFWFNFGPGSRGTPHKTTVKLATDEIEAEVTLEDARKAAKAGGQGNSMLCAGSQCLARLSKDKIFPHPVFAPTDWLKRRVFITDRKSRDDRPLSCIVYSHDSDEDLARLFDENPRKLIRHIERHGPLKIRLKPPRITKNHPPPEGFVRRFTGTRSGKIHDVVAFDNQGLEVPPPSGGSGLPRPTATGEIDGPPREWLTSYGAKHRFARAFYGLGTVKPAGRHV